MQTFYDFVGPRTLLSIVRISEEVVVKVNLNCYQNNFVILNRCKFVGMIFLGKLSW